MEWFRRFSQAIDYLEANLDGDISYDEAAKIACCSTFYFHRMFSYVAGIPLSDYIRRRRMTKAAFDLQNSGAKVMEIGSKYGYGSPTSFHRAFRLVHGVAPSAARIKGTLLNAYPRIQFSISVSGGEGLRYRIESKPPTRIVGLRVAIEEDVERNFEMVPKFWNRTISSGLLSEIKHLSSHEPYGVLGVTVYQNPMEIYYYIAVSTDKAIPEGLVECVIPAATWVVFEGEGSYPDAIQQTYRRFLTEWLPFSGYEYAQLPDVEVYPLETKQSGGGKFQVWIAVKPAG
jgi:AraC family transcriptional regulator